MNTRNRYWKYLSIAAIVIIHYSISNGQVQQPGRYEKERKYTDRDFTIIPLKEDGLALIREKNKYKSGNQTWELVLLDTTLQEKGTVELEIDVQNKLIGFEHSPGYIYLLFNTNEIRGDMEVISIELNSHEVLRYEVKPELKLQLTHFIKAGDNFVFGGVINLEPAVLLYTTATRQLKVLPGFFQKAAELIDLRVNQNQTFNALLIDQGDRENNRLIFRTFDPSGNSLLEDITHIDENITILTGITSSLEREDLMVMGTWAKFNGKQASGFYTLTVNPFAEQKIKRLYLGQLSHYLDYLKPKKAASVKEKTARAIEEGKMPDFTNYIMPYKIIEYESGFLLLSETYTISGNDNSYSNYSPYSYYSPMGGYYPTNRIYNPGTAYPQGNNFQNPQEIKLMEATLLAVDPAGSVLWDYSMRFQDIKLPSLEQTSDFHLSRDSVYFIYKKETDLKTKAISLDDSESFEHTLKSRLFNMSDEIRSEKTQEGTVRHWYGGNFYVWGYQSIRNRTSNEFASREVFYINKLAVR